MLTRTALVAAVLALALAGCGDDGPPPRSAAPTPSVPSSASAPGAADPAVTDVTEATTFRSPTGNISCLLDQEYARCDIVEYAYVPPPAADCELDYGQTVELSSEEASFTCAGDTVADPDAATLAYGSALRSANVLCTSEQDGVRCRHLLSGTGFRLSRGSFDLT